MAGMEILFSAVQAQIRAPEDAVVCCLHFNLISNGFRCIGNGEDIPTTNEGIKRSELLPSGWNESSEVYAMRYWPEGSEVTHILKIIKMDNMLLVHYLRTSDEKAVDMMINIGDYATGDLTSYESAYKDLDGLSKKFKTEIIDPLKEKPKTAASTSRVQQEQRSQPRRDEDDPLRVPPRRGQGHRYDPDWGGVSDPFSVGRGDLDPLAGGHGGGMLMDPFRSGIPGMGGGGGLGPGIPGQLPRGAVPPGARFDPFGPPNPDPVGPPGRGGHRAGPDPDHLPPPGFDDMFM